MKKLIGLSLVIMFVAALVFAAIPAQTGHTAVAATVCPMVGWNSKPASVCGTTGGIAIVLPTYPMKIMPLVGWNS